MKTQLLKIKGRDFVKYLDALQAILLKFFSMLFLVLMPIRPVMIAVSVLVIADLITGVWASKKEKKPITSSGLKKTIAKTLAYQSAILVAFIIETWMIPEVPVVKTLAGLIALTEGKSFFENLNRITGIDFWTAIMSKMSGDWKSTLDKKRVEK